MDGPGVQVLLNSNLIDCANKLSHINSPVSGTASSVEAATTDKTLLTATAPRAGKYLILADFRITSNSINQFYIGMKHNGTSFKSFQYSIQNGSIVDKTIYSVASLSAGEVVDIAGREHNLVASDSLTGLSLTLFPLN